MPSIRSKDSFPTHWAGGGSETDCGGGSTAASLENAIKYTQMWLEYHFRDYQYPEKIISLGCGDLAFDAPAIINYVTEYVGIDIQRRDTWKSQEQFMSVKLLESSILDPPPEFQTYEADVVVARDVFIHLPTKMVQQVMARVRAGYLLATTYPGADNNKRIPAPSHGFSPLDMAAPPFKLKQELLIQEHAPGKFLGVFKL